MSINWNTFQLSMRLRYKLPAMQRRINDAQQWLIRFFKRSGSPCVSFSGGKDSLVALDLALSLHPQLGIVWHDEGWYPPGTYETIAGVEEYYAVHVTRVHRWPLSGHWLKRYGVDPVCSYLTPVEFSGNSWREIYQHFGWDGAIIAMRKEESKQRRNALKRPLRYLKTARIWRVSPIADWSYMDVWAYILGKKLPYHRAYEAMIDFGIEPQFARIGPLTAVARMHNHGMVQQLKYLWPDQWNRFVQENPCVMSDA